MAIGWWCLCGLTCLCLCAVRCWPGTSSNVVVEDVLALGWSDSYEEPDGVYDDVNVGDVDKAASDDRVALGVFARTVAYVKHSGTAIWDNVLAR